MSDVAAPGNPGGTRGKSCPQQVRGPVTEDGDESSETSMGMGSRVVFGTQPGSTSGRKGNPVR